MLQVSETYHIFAAWNQVEPRCAERWHLCDDEQFDLAAWFPSLKIGDSVTL